MALKQGTIKNHQDQNIKLAVDNCIFTVRDGKLFVLLIKMKYKFPGQWALPGGLVGNKEDLDQAAKRILEAETAVADVYLEQLYTFSNLSRDPLARVISVAYFALISSTGVKLLTSDKYSEVAWYEYSKLPNLAYDHNEIVKYAKKRLEWKVGYTNAVWALLPAKFTLSQLQEVYEAIIEKPLDKRNFRRKILDSKLVETVGQKTLDGAHRPAELYRFVTKKQKFIEII